MTRNRLFVALALAVMLALGFLGYRTYLLRYGDAQLAAHYYPDVPVTLPANDTTNYYAGLSWLREDGYPQATAALNRVPRTDPDYPSAQYYAGHAYYRNGQLNAAMTALQNVTDLGPSTVREDAEWLLALTYLRAGRTERNFFGVLGRIAEQENHRHHAAGRALAADFRSPWRTRWEALAYGRGAY